MNTRLMTQRIRTILIEVTIVNFPSKQISYGQYDAYKEIKYASALLTFLPVYDIEAQQIEPIIKTNIL